MTHKEKVLALLSDGKPHTHHELYALGCVAHSRVSDLRRDGHNIVCSSEISRSGRVSVYQLLSSLDDATGIRASLPVVSSSEETPPIPGPPTDHPGRGDGVLVLFQHAIPVDQPPLFAA
jgi:hypothetical protein